MKLEQTFVGLAFALVLTALPACQPTPRPKNLYLECKIGDKPSFNYDQPSTYISDNADRVWFLYDEGRRIGTYPQKQGEFCVVVSREGESYEQ
jgi:hypothetical protein